MNRVILMGRITQDLEMKVTANGNSVLSFSIAVDRGYVKPGEERQADFINCVAWRQTAEFINRCFAKGRMIAVEGTLRTESYEKDGVKRHVTKVYVSNVYFTGEKKPEEATVEDTAVPVATKVSVGEVEVNEFEVDDLEGIEEIPF